MIHAQDGRPCSRLLNAEASLCVCMWVHRHKYTLAPHNLHRNKTGPVSAKLSNCILIPSQFFYLKETSDGMEVRQTWWTRKEAGRPALIDAKARDSYRCPTWA